MAIIYSYPIITPSSDDLILLSDTSSGDKATKTASVSSILDLGVVTTQPVLPVATLTVEGTDDTTTAVASYGINTVSTSSSSDYCCRLPTATTGREVIIVNNSLLPIVIFPSATGGNINGVVNGSASVPPDGRSYSFFCVANPLPGSWTWSPPAIAQIAITEISVPHTNGGGDTNKYNAGQGGANFASAGMGMVGSTISLTGDWRTELFPARMSRVKIYTNILWSDLGGTSGVNAIKTALLQGYQDTALSTTYGQRYTADFYGSSASPATGVQEITGGIGTGVNVGDFGTLYMYQDASTTLSPLYQIIGDNYNQSIPGILSNGFYTFGVFIDTTAATKTYKFKWFIEYY